MVDLQAATQFMDEFGIYVEGVQEGTFYKINGAMNLYFTGLDGLARLEPVYNQNNLIGFKVAPEVGEISVSSELTGRKMTEVRVGIGGRTSDTKMIGG